jgi:hypothetical protein
VSGRDNFSGLFSDKQNFCRSKVGIKLIFRRVERMAHKPEGPQISEAGASAEPVSKNKRYRKPKPWDTDDIDHVFSFNLHRQPFLLEFFC